MSGFHYNLSTTFLWTRSKICLKYFDLYIVLNSVRVTLWYVFSNIFLFPSLWGCCTQKKWIRLRVLMLLQYRNYTHSSFNLAWVIHTDTLIFKWPSLSFLYPPKKQSKIYFILWGITLNKMKKQFASKTYKGERVCVFVWVFGDIASSKPEAPMTQREMVCLIPEVSEASGFQPGKLYRYKQWICFVWLTFIWQGQTEVGWTYFIF